MKKNMVVMLMVIVVIGVLAYLLRDKLKVVLGQRVERKKIKGEMGISGPTNGLGTKEAGVGPVIEMKEFKTPATIEAALKLPTARYDYAAEWIGADIVGAVTEIYPKMAEHGKVLDSLISCKKMEVPLIGLPSTNGPGYKEPTIDPLVELKKFETYTGPYIALPQF